MTSFGLQIQIISVMACAIFRGNISYFPNVSALEQLIQIGKEKRQSQNGESSKTMCLLVDHFLSFQILKIYLLKVTFLHVSKLFRHRGRIESVIDFSLPSKFLSSSSDLNVCGKMNSIYGEMLKSTRDLCLKVYVTKLCLNNSQRREQIAKKNGA